MDPTLFDFAEPRTVAPVITGDVCANRHGGNEQSEAANERAAPHKSETCSKIYAHLVALLPGGLTVEEISEALGLRYTTASARVSDLQRLGLVRRPGLTRPTRGGSPAGVVVAVK